MVVSAMDIVIGTSLGVLILADVIFYLYVRYIILPPLQRHSKRHPPLLKNPEDSFRQFVTQIKELESYSFQKYCSGFFLNAKFEDIKSRNFESFIAWTLFAKDLSAINDDEKIKITELSKELLEYFLVEMEDGYNPNIRHVTVDFDAVKHTYRPVLLYLLLNITECCSNMKHLLGNGFTRYKCGKISYWYRPGKNTSKTPLIFLHGICSGWSYYAEAIKVFGDNRSIILIDCDFVKLNWISLYVPDPWSFNETVTEILNRHKINRVSIIAHSWGTFLAGWFVKQSAHMIDHMTLIDPVSLTFLFPETTYVIVYKVSETIEDHLLDYFVRHDLSVSNTIHRNFTWYNEALQLRDIPKSVNVVISASTEDVLVCFNVLEEMITKENSLNRSDNPISFIHWDKFSHGQVISNKPALKSIRDRIESNKNIFI